MAVVTNEKLDLTTKQVEVVTATKAAAVQSQNIVVIEHGTPNLGDIINSLEPGTIVHIIPKKLTVPEALEKLKTLPKAEGR